MPTNYAIYPTMPSQIHYLPPPLRIAIGGREAGAKDGLV